MPLILFNVKWMVLNAMLAILPVLLGHFFLNAKAKSLKIFFGLFWVLFLPNTVYVFTDLKHILYQWQQVDMLAQFFLLLQYMILEFIGLVTFILAFHPAERVVEQVAHLKKRRVSLIIAFNFLVAFGMVLGRVERLNSWELFTQPMKVIGSAWHVLTSLDLLGLTILFGLFCNFVYFLFHETVLYDAKKLYGKYYRVIQCFLNI